MAGKNASVGMRIASQKSSGAPKDGSFRDIRPTSNKPQCPYNNPSKVVVKGMEHKVGKLGK